MSVQRAEVHWARYLDGNRRVVLEADHARIVAEAGAAVFAFHPEWTVTGMCDPDCLACRRLTELITEREKGYEEGKADAEQEHAAALAEATDRQRARDYVSLWSRLMLEDRKYRAALARAAIVIRQRLTDSDVFRLTGQSVRLHEWETVKPLPADKAVAPRTLTADDPGYHSQRCLHCDHIRATHTLTAHGCIGHALPGRPGADCPCAEFIHDGEAGR